MKELVPALARAAVHLRAPVLHDWQVFRVRGIELPVLPIRDDSDFEPVFAVMAQERVGGLIVNTAPRFLGRPRRLLRCLPATRCRPCMTARNSRAQAVS